MRIRFTFLLCTMLLFTQLFGQNNKPVQDSSKPAKNQSMGQFAIRHLQEDIDEILSASELSGASLGLSVINIETGEILYKKNPHILLIPASTMKLFTTATALEILGPDFRYATRIYIDGVIKDSGELDGDIIIRASGDPSMSLLYMKDPGVILDNIALALDSMHITSIKGNIILDHGYFDNEAFGPGWAIDDIPYPYSAPISAISFYDNKVELSFKPGIKAGDYSRLTIIPDNSYLRIVNNVMTVSANAPTLLETDSDPRSGVIDIQGAIALPDAQSVQKKSSGDQAMSLGLSIDDPVQYFLHVFKQRLEKMGIRIRGSLLRNELVDGPISYSELKVLYTHVSPPIASIIQTINTFSHNLGADMLLKTMGKEQFGEGSFMKGTESVKKFLTSIGIMPEQCSIVDGSGLSRLNLLSAQQQTTLLSKMYRSSTRDVFRASLAKPGMPGTLNNRMLKSLAQQHVIAKTGSMNNVSCLSGYITTRDEENLAFSIMINGFTAPDGIIRNIQDMICMRLSSFTRK